MPPGSVLIVRMSAFGDIICALPTVRAIQDSFPGCRIGWVVDERFRELVAHDPSVDEVIVVPLARWRKGLGKPRTWMRHLSELAELRRQLRQGRYEVCLDIQGIGKSALVTRTARCPRVLQMAGDHLGRVQWLFPGERAPELGQHAVDRMLGVAAALGADVSRPRFDLFIPPAARAHAEGLLAEAPWGASDGPLVALNPATSAPHRVWPAERFALLAARLWTELGARVVVLGGPAEVALAEGIARDSGVPVLCTAGRTGFLQLAAVLDQVSVLVSGDTGPMHLAAALGKPVATLFGPSNPDRTGAYGPGHVIVRKPFPCQPCYAHPTCGDYHCMAAITVDDVFEAVRSRLP